MRIVAALLLALLVPSGGAAGGGDPVSATVNADRRAITLGDPILLTLTVEVAPGYQVVDPGVPRALGDFEVLETLPALQERRSGVTILRFRYRITTFRLGERTLPPIEVGYLDPAGQREVTRTPELLFVVEGVIPENEDARDIRPLKPQLELPGSFLFALARAVTIAAAALALALAASLLLLRLRRRAPAFLGPRVKPVQRALIELDRIATLGLPAKGRYDEHYELMSHTLRAYLHEKFGLAALERTPRELKGEMERAGVDRQLAGLILEVLRDADLARFHRLPPYPRHAEEAVRRAVEVMRRAAAAERAAIEEFEAARTG